VSDRLTAEPGTLEFLRQLLEIAQESDHPMDKALTKVLSKQIGDTEAVGSSPQAEDSDMGGLDNAHYGD
jgi:hypothetical protein